MIKKVSLGLLVLALSTSCVSKKIYTDLESKYTDLKKENRTLADENAALAKAKNQLELDSAALKTDLDRLKADYTKLKAEHEANVDKYKALQDSYAALEKNSNESLESNMKKNRELLDELDEKAKALAIAKNLLTTMNDGDIAKITGLAVSVITQLRNKV